MNTRKYQQLCRRAERAGYDGDIADLIHEDHERAQEQRQWERAEQQRAEIERKAS